VIRALPELKTIGLSGNKCTDDNAINKLFNWRIKLLMLLPELHQKWCSLRMLDEEEITVDEIVQAWKDSKQDTHESKNFRFQVLLLRQIPKDKDPHVLTELNFANSGLDNVDLSNYIQLNKLSLRNNAIKSLDDANFSALKELQGLDLRDNHLKDLDSVAVHLKDLPKMRLLFLEGNPCYPLEEKDPEIRRKFLSKMLHHVDIRLLPFTALNGKRVTINEKCSALKKNKTAENVEEIRLELAFKEKGVEANHTYLDLTGYGFYEINGLHLKTPKLTHLNLSNNNLKILDPTFFKSMPTLTYLDLSNNSLWSLKDIMEYIAPCTTLETLFLINSTKDKKQSSIPKDYAFKVCKILRFLMFVDGLKNPFGTIAQRKKMHKGITRMVLREAAAAQNANLNFSKDSEDIKQLAKSDNLSDMYKKEEYSSSSTTDWDSLYKPPNPKESGKDEN